MKYTEKKEAVKKIPIQKYFNDIIIPNMESYYQDLIVDFDLKPVTKCPLHDENTPSMRYYHDTNTFYCWGCGRGGDIIELHRKFCDIVLGNRYSFESAIEFLYKRYIENNISLSEIKTKSNEKEELSTPKELFRLSRKVITLEERIQASNISLEEKEKIWSLLDNIQILVDLNKVSALEGISLLENKIEILNKV